MRTKRYFNFYVFSALFCAVPFSVGAPSIESSSISGGSLIENGVEVVVRGSGFGEKMIAAPVIVDHVGQAYEYGKLNSNGAKLTDMQKILPASEDPNSLWGSATDNVRFAKSLPKRHSLSGGAYMLEGASSWIGGPVAYGGTSGWETPKNNEQLYASWWYKPEYNPIKYWRVSQEGQKGKFASGERISVGSYGGVYVGVDSFGFHNIVMDEHLGIASLKGGLIKGAKSGASSIFPTTAANGGNSGFVSPGSKVVRVWDDPRGVDGIRFSWAERDAYVSIPHANGGAGSMNKIYEMMDVEGGKWNHLEVAIDRAKGSASLFVNSRKHGDIKFDPQLLKDIGRSPIMSLVGISGKATQLMKGELTDIYMDSSVQRVMFGNAAKISDVTHSEVQRITSWDDGSIRFSAMLGALEAEHGLYLYVFDEEGKVNESGYKLCSECKAPPKSPVLKVE